MSTTVMKRPCLVLTLAGLLWLMLNANNAKASQCLIKGAEQHGKALQVDSGFALVRWARSFLKCKQLCLSWKRCHSVNWMDFALSCELIITTSPNQGTVVDRYGSVFAAIELGTCGVSCGCNGVEKSRSYIGGNGMLV